jgi:parallel beta-helix repeat protein
MGAGANNASVVANHKDGILVGGTSRNTQIGGVIPLGNVISGNDGNGTEIRDQASGTVNFNTFAGVFAFSGAAPNKRDGFLITSTGGNNLIRTCIVAGNLGHGIEIGGHASGVQVEQTASGTNTAVQYSIPNGGSGLVLSGQAHDNSIGGLRPSVESQNDFSGNARYGIEVKGSAHDNVIFNSYVGQSDATGKPIPNRLGGIFLGPGTWATTVGSLDRFKNLIASNTGPGIVVSGSRKNLIFNNEVSANSDAGVRVSGNVSGTGIQNNDIHDNLGDGVSLASTRQLTVGGGLAGLGNRILSNRGFGLTAVGYSPGTVVQNNVIALNNKGNVDLSRSRGVQYIP